MRSPKLALTLAQTILAATLVSCGGGTSTAPPPPAPLFTSTPVTSATEAMAYAYTLSATDPAGGAVTFALTTAPTGASLSGNTLAWTPAHAQSRIADNFTVTATTTSGGTATQSWTVSPAGTILITWTDTYWTGSGSTPTPNDFPLTGFPRAVVAQPDGSFLSITGSETSPGNYAIPAVPAGYFLLLVSPNTIYSTSSSAFDFGRDIVGRLPAALPVPDTTTIDITGTGLDAQAANGLFLVQPDSSLVGLPFETSSTPGSTTASTGAILNSNLDFSTIDLLFLMQYASSSTGTLPALVLDEAATVPDPMIKNGQTNSITQMLTQGPLTTLEVNVKGTQWASLFSAIAPAPPIPLTSVFYLSAQPFVTDGFAAVPLNSNIGPSLALVASQPTLQFFIPALTTCADDSGSSSSSFGNPVPLTPILTDQDFGIVTYSDPFPAAWLRYESFCQITTTPITFPGAAAPINVQLDFGAITAVSSAPVVPLTSAPLAPTVNGASFYTAATLTTTTPTIAWSAPSGSTPTAYTVTVLDQLTAPNNTTFAGPIARYNTTKNSITLLPLLAGKTYFFLITSKIDGHANIETNPNRSQLPVAFASTISAAFTISSSATSPAVRDR